MLTVIEKLLVLQDRDRQIAQVRAELEMIRPQRDTLQHRARASRSSLDAAHQRSLHLEADRKRLELEVESRKEQIARYSMQQFQTKRNEEYRALSHEIDNCKSQIVGLEDQQLELMEQSENLQRLIATARQEVEEQTREGDRLLAELASREKVLLGQCAELEQGRETLSKDVDPSLLARYERLRHNKGGRVVVGVDHGACGGCHVGLPAQVVLQCRGAQELTQCPNCGRILFYTRDMDLVRAD